MSWQASAGVPAVSADVISKKGNVMNLKDVLKRLEERLRLLQFTAADHAVMGRPYAAAGCAAAAGELSAALDELRLVEDHQPTYRKKTS
jgi:hypothetical protein